MTASPSSRWLPVALAASLLAGALAVIAVGITNAASSSPSSFVPIVPCRLVDTRPDTQVGTRGAPVGANGTVTFAVWGSNGDCSIPGNAVGIASNVTVVGPTAPSFLTVYPADAPTRPNASNLNYVAGSPPTPNQVTVALSDAGAISVYNLAGSVDVIVDIVGYYVPAQAAVTPTTAAPTTTTAPPARPKLLQSVQPGTSFLPHCAGCDNYATFIDLPPGRWLISYTVTVVNFSGVSDLFRCGLVRDSAGFWAMTTSRVGPNLDVSPHSGELAVTVTASSERIRIACHHDSNIGGSVGLMDNAYLETGVLSALEVAP